jgi:hypothetical protein
MAADAEQFAQDVYGIMLAWNHHSRLLANRDAEARARRAFEVLPAAARVSTPHPY